MVAAVIVVAVSLAGNALAPVPFTTISQSEQSGVEEARQVVVRTPEEWKALWKEHAPGQPMPAVDFTKSMVIGVFLGSRNTAGYRVTITGIERDGAIVTVTYREERPAARDILAQVITFPHHLVRLERTAGEVKFARPER
jgi:protease stability complex PrcB-like protein